MIRKAPAPHLSALLPKLHLTTLNPPLVANFYSPVVVRGMKLSRREEAPSLKDVQAILPHFPIRLTLHLHWPRNDSNSCRLPTCAH